MPESLRIAVLPYRHPERAETTYLRQPLPERVRTESKDLFVPRFLAKEVQAGSIGRTGVVRRIIIGKRRKYIYKAMPESLRIAVLSYRHPKRAETTYLRQPLPEQVRTASKDLFVPRFLTKEDQQVL